MLPLIAADTENVSSCQTSTAAHTLGPHPRRAHWWTRFIGWVVEARSHRVLCLVFGIWLLNAFDLTFTILAHENGMLDEQNPVARHVLQRGTPSVMLFKIGLVIIGSYPLLRFRRTRIAELGALVVLVAYAGLAVRWSNCLEVYSMTMPNSANYADIESMTQNPPQ
jgi:hypothetical protein